MSTNDLPPVDESWDQEDENEENAHQDETPHGIPIPSTGDILSRETDDDDGGFPGDDSAYGNGGGDDDDDDYDDDYEDQPPPPPNKKKLYALMALGLLALGAMIGGGLYFKSAQQAAKGVEPPRVIQERPAPAPAPAPAPTAAPATTPPPASDARPLPAPVAQTGPGPVPVAAIASDAGAQPNVLDVAQPLAVPAIATREAPEPLDPKRVVNARGIALDDIEDALREDIISLQGKVDLLAKAFVSQQSKIGQLETTIEQLREDMKKQGAECDCEEDKPEPVKDNKPKPATKKDVKDTPKKAPPASNKASAQPKAPPKKAPPKKPAQKAAAPAPKPSPEPSISSYRVVATYPSTQSEGLAAEKAWVTSGEELLQVTVGSVIAGAKVTKIEGTTVHTTKGIIQAQRH